MCGIVTTLISQKGGFTARINEVFDTESDGYRYTVMETGRTYKTHRAAVVRARRYLKILRMAYNEALA